MPSRHVLQLSCTTVQFLRAILVQLMSCYWSFCRSTLIVVRHYMNLFLNDEKVQRFPPLRTNHPKTQHLSPPEPTLSPLRDFPRLAYKLSSPDSRPATIREPLQLPRFLCSRVLLASFASGSLSGVPPPALLLLVAPVEQFSCSLVSSSQ
jgi:hypothetical protein